MRNRGRPLRRAVATGAMLLGLTGCAAPPQESARSGNLAGAPASMGSASAPADTSSGAWRTRCRIDRFTDRRECSLYAEAFTDRGGVSLFTGSWGAWSVERGLDPARDVVRHPGRP